MIADHNALHSLAQWAPTLAVAVLAIGWLMGSFQRGRSDAGHEAISIANEEIEVLKTARDRLTADLAETQSRLTDATAAIAKLEGVVDQLRTENAELRKLVALEVVPPAMLDALKEVVGEVMTEVSSLHRETRDALVAHFDRQIDANRLYWSEAVTDHLHPIEQGIARLLAEPEGR